MIDDMRETHEELDEEVHVKMIIQKLDDLNRVIDREEEKKDSIDDIKGKTK